jgi:hypothetical protein
MECPKCGLESPTNTMTCDCGHSFSVEELNVVAKSRRTARSYLKMGALVVGSFSSVALSVFALNYFSIIRPVNQVVDLDPRNAGVAVWVHYDRFLNTKALVYDLRSVSPTNSMTDVFRVLLQSAMALKTRRFERVELSFRGSPRFVLDGAYFQRLGEEYDSQNPVYTMRTFAANLYRTDGSKAYPEWSGGWLGVLQKEIDQFKEFQKEWYLNELSAP